MVAVLRATAHARTMGETTVVNLATIALGLLTGILTARGLQPVDRGIVLALVLWSNQVSTLAILGIDEAIISFANGDESSAAELAAALARRLRAWIAATTIVGFGAGMFLDPTRSVANGMICAAIVWFGAHTLILFAVTRSAQRVRRWNMLRLMQPVMYMVILLGLFILELVTVTTVISALLAANVLTYVTTRSCLPPRGRARLTPSVQHYALRYGRQLLAANLPYLLLLRVDQIILSLVAPPDILGTYSVASSLSAIVGVVGVSAEQILFPAFSASKVGAAGARNLAIALLGVIVIPALVVACSSGYLITMVYGNAYSDATRYIAWLMCASVFRTGTGPLRAHLKAVGEARRLFGVNATALLVGAGVGVTGYHLYGAVGVSLAFAASALSEFVLLVHRSRDYLA